MIFINLLRLEVGSPGVNSTSAISSLDIVEICGMIITGLVGLKRVHKAPHETGFTCRSELHCQSHVTPREKAPSVIAGLTVQKFLDSVHQYKEARPNVSPQNSWSVSDAHSERIIIGISIRPRRGMMVSFPA